ncbi:MAG: carbon-nitrogen hydrolase family protein [Planctomycetia bacterium]|nr:carbon-nitrogen hydrolase family protein [Planctomycetia bacterium]
MIYRFLCLTLGVVCGMTAWGQNDWTGASPELVSPARFFQDDEGLGIELSTPDSLGTWTGTVPVKPGRGCRITGMAELRGLPDVGNDCMMMVSWFAPEKKNPVQRDYVDFTDEASTRRFDQTFTVPEGCRTLRLECFLKWRAGTVVFRNIQVAETEPLQPRNVCLVVANPFPSTPRTLEGNLQAMEETLRNIFAKVPSPDLILFAECFTDSGTGKSIRETAEKLPGGPTFQLFSRYAREHRVWIVGNVHEVSESGTFHNTSFLVNREGDLAGIYRKVHLTSSEFQKGVLPGRELPVFETDFGKVGIVTCWDNWFSETAKVLRRKGAELLLFPLAGDAKESHWGKIWSARAIDTSLPMLVAVQQSHLPAAIIDRDGEWLAETRERNGFVQATLDLTERKRSFWLSVGPSLGDPYQLYLHESRPQAYQGWESPKSPRGK